MCFNLLPAKGRRERKSMNTIEIWQPRYKDNKCLIATYKVKSGYNYIVFTKAKHLEGKLYRVHSIDVLDCPVQKNGAGAVFVVPMERLELVQDEKEQKPTIHKIKVDIDGKVREFTTVEDVLTALSKLLEGTNGK